jgi:GDPmannose 4,6-dehydratase
LAAPVALITGITGQDGAYLSRLLLAKGYVVHGVVRRSSSFNTWRIDEIRTSINLHYGDMLDGSSLFRILETIKPNEIYNLAAQSHVGVSFETPEYTAETGSLGPLRILEAIRVMQLPARFYQASTSEMFGSSPPPQSELTAMCPRSPYGAAKLYTYWIVRQYREAYGMHASNGILFNHESPFRGENFVTRKVCKAAARNEPLRLWNLLAVRDWGHAKDYVEGMWRMLQQPKGDDYVLATGVGHTVGELVEEAYRHVKWEPRFSPDESQKRPLEVDCLIGDYSKAKSILGWEPKISFRELITEIMESEIDSARKA